MSHGLPEGFGSLVWIVVRAIFYRTVTTNGNKRSTVCSADTDGVVSSGYSGRRYIEHIVVVSHRVIIRRRVVFSAHV